MCDLKALVGFGNLMEKSNNHGEPVILEDILVLFNRYG
jgi:hypothetical protein